MGNPAFRFEPSSHSYWKGTTRFPSVTELVRAAGLSPSNEFASPWKGTAIHQATADYDLDVTGIIDPDFDWYIDSWSAACKSIGVAKWLAVEKPMLCEIGGFGWTADRITVLKSGKPAILELKTGPHEPWHRIQVAGYRYGFQFASEFESSEFMRGQVEGYLVYLRSGLFPEIIKQGRVRAEAVNDLAMFHNALGCASWRIRHGLFWSEKKES